MLLKVLIFAVLVFSAVVEVVVVDTANSCTCSGFSGRSYKIKIPHTKDITAGIRKTISQGMVWSWYKIKLANSAAVMLPMY